MSAVYFHAAAVLDRVLARRGSVKHLVLSNKTAENKKKLYALVCQTLKHYSLLQKIMSAAAFLQEEPSLSTNIAAVVLYDFLFGRGLRCGGKLKAAVYRQKDCLRTAMEQLKGSEEERKTDVRLPRYVRVNTLKTTWDDAVGHFQQRKWTLSENESQSSGRCFRQDNHVPHLMVFPSGTDLHDDPMYVSGQVILQDKASCLPAFLLSPPSGSNVIDACAAPGNKTSHLASLMKNKGSIFAFDIDGSRLETMRELMVRAGATCCKMKRANFLRIKPEDYKDVEYILVDPSCSGSGIVSHVERTIEKGETPQWRIEKLAQFQLSVLLHALRFPSARRVVYSTCSIHKEENEEVVEKALKSNRNFTLVHALPEWPRRGLPLFSTAEYCVRTSTEDETQGFFVAVFERKTTEPKIALKVKTRQKTKQRKHRSVVD